MEDEDYQQQQDEMCALEAIYADKFERLTENSFKVYIPNDKGRSDLELTVRYRKTYPSLMYPDVHLYADWLSNSKLAALKEELIQQFVENAGMVIVYNWVEWLRENVEVHSLDAKNESPAPEIVEEPNSDGEDKPLFTDEGIKSNANVIPVALPEKEFMGGVKADEFTKQARCPKVFSDEAFTDRKSTFQAHCAEVHSEEEVKLVLQYLYTNNKIQRATHNMYAYRIYNEAKGTWYQDNDDDGESAAGSRMLHLMCMMDVKNVLVVVSRWWGGILLGPDRFKHINNATRNVLEKCGFVASEHKKKGKK